MTAAFNHKVLGAMTLGFASALPFVFLTGTLTVWISELGVSMALLGLFSWITLAYSFKMLWAPFIARGLHRWIGACLAGLAATFFGLALIDPQAQLGLFGLIAFAAALIAATQDTAFEAWRIRMADHRTPIEWIMTASQMGARLAGPVAGAAALWLSAVIGWRAVTLAMAALFTAIALLVLLTRELRDEADSPEQCGPPVRADPAKVLAITIVGLCFAASFALIVQFMARLIQQGPQAQANAEHFIAREGAFIILSVTLIPILASQLERWGSRLPAWLGRIASPRATARLHEGLVAPYGDLAARFGYRLVLLLLLVATYTLSWFSWAGFTMPLYLHELGFSKGEVAVAARLYGAAVTVLGILAGGLLLVRLGRRPALLIGALLPILSNLTYADLATGGAQLKMVIAAVAPQLAGPETAETPGLAALYLAITVKNLISGIASGIFVGFLAGLVSRHNAVIQCAIMSCVSITVGTIGSAAAGAAIDQVGFAQMTYLSCAVAVVSALIAAFAAQLPAAEPQ